MSITETPDIQSSVKLASQAVAKKAPSMVPF